MFFSFLFLVIIIIIIYNKRVNTFRIGPYLIMIYGPRTITITFLKGPDRSSPFVSSQFNFNITITIHERPVKLLKRKRKRKPNRLPLLSKMVALSPLSRGHPLRISFFFINYVNFTQVSHISFKYNGALNDSNFITPSYM